MFVKIVGKISLIVIMLMVISLNYSVVYADNNSCCESFENLFPVGGYGEKTPKYTFEWDEQPYIYLDFPSDVSIITFSLTKWVSPTSSHYYDYDITLFSNETWHWLNNWDQIKEVGDWVVKAYYSGISRERGIVCGRGRTHFTVTPEPQTALLFSLGLGFLLPYLRKKFL